MLRRFLVLLIFAVGLQACATTVIRDPEKLKNQPVYREADYLALIEVDCKWKNKEYLDELSGFLIYYKSKYYVVTAGHIYIEGWEITNILVSFKKDTSKKFSAVLLGYDQSYDLAILALSDPDFKFDGRTAILGDSEKVSVGDMVYSLGHPVNYYWYISGGEIKEKNHKKNHRVLKCDTIQHSAISGYGSSGGPLLDKNGKVIGMNVAIFVAEKQRISDKVLAIPVNAIKKRLDDLVVGYKN